MPKTYVCYCTETIGTKGPLRIEEAILFEMTILHNCCDDPAWFTVLLSNPPVSKVKMIAEDVFQKLHEDMDAERMEDIRWVAILTEGGIRRVYNLDPETDFAISGWRQLQSVEVEEILQYQPASEQLISRLLATKDLLYAPMLTSLTPGAIYASA